MRDAAFFGPGRGAARLVLLLLALAAAPAAAREVASASSPGGVLRVAVSLDGEGRPGWSLSRRGRPVMNDGRLGLSFTDARKFERGVELAGTDIRRSDTSWRQPWGEWEVIRDRHVELLVRLRERGNGRRRVDVRFRLFDDGIGFRYEVPAQGGWGTARVADELTQFALAADGTGWWAPAFEWNREEYLYQRTALSAVGTAQTPFTARLADGLHVSIHEAALVDYPGMNLARSEGTTFRAALTPSAAGPKAVRDLPFATPWRTVLVSPDAAGLYMSHVMLNLNEPNRLGDVSWVRPGKFVGVWWNMIKGDWTWATGPRHGATTANVRRYIDFAAANGVPGVLVEGWNVGWDGDWFGNGNAMDFARPTPDFDADGLAAYARSRGVRLIGHHETGGSASHYDAQLDRAFAWAAAHGEAVVKTGYVTDAGQIERVDPDGTRLREWHEGQWMANHYLRVVQAAARHRVSIDSHEPIKDTGLRRTWPNWMAREGQRGMEYNAWPGKNPPDHEPNLLFTRMLGGPMDFTPGIVSLAGSGGAPINSTLARQLALYVVLYSPLQMLADTPEAYPQVPEAMPFLRAVPTDWSDTRVLAGEVGEHAAVARRVRGGRDWWLGAVTDGQARTVPVTLDFLEPGRRYRATVYADGPGADYRTGTRRAMSVTERAVRRGDVLAIPMGPGGGYAVRIAAR